MPTKFIYVVRRDKLWHEKKIVSAHFERYFNPIITEWNDTFTTSYFEFKNMMEEIRLKNQLDLRFDNYVNSYDLHLSADDIFVPIDEDDWFHPDIVDALKDSLIETNLDNLGYRWNIIKYYPGEIKSLESPFDGEKYLWHSNNYAISRLNNHDFLNHVTFCNHNKNAGGIYVPKYLSAYNKNLASLTLRAEIDSKLKDKKLIELYDDFKQEPKILGFLPPYFEKLVFETLRVYRNKLKVKKKFI